MVEFRSKLDSNKSQALNKNAFKRMWWIFALLSLVFIAMGVVNIVMPEENGDIVFGIVIMAIGVLFTPLVYLISRLIQKNYDKSTTFISPDTEEVYTFDEQYITVTQTKGDEYIANTKAKYSYVYKAYEDKSYYYLYISKMQCHVIDKASITVGTLDEMRELLKINLGDKYKCK